MKTQIQAKVDEVKQQLRQLGAPQMELAGVNVGRISDTGTVGKNTSSSSPKPSNSQPPQNSSNKKPADNKGTGNIGNKTRDQARHTAQNLLKNGEVSMSNLESMIPSNIPNSFKPTDTTTDGAKYEFTLADGQKAIIRWHSPDPVAASKYPGSASGSRWAAQIKIGNKQLKSDGTWTKKQYLNEVHISIEGK